MDKEGKLAIIAGGGVIPKMLIEHLKKTGREFFVFAIKDNAEPDLVDDSTPHMWMRMGQAGSGFERLKKEKIKEAVLIGTIKRPGFFDIVPDFRTTAFFGRIAAKSLGDDGLLRAVVKEFEKDGVVIKGIHEVMNDIMVKEGTLGKIKPDKQALIDIKRGVEIVTELGKLDVGQAVVIQQGIVLGVEGIEGTDELIRRCGEYKRKGKGGVLVKIKKSQQDMRIDLPTIGVQTVKRAAETGLRGIVVHAHNGLIVDEEKVIKEADKAKIFVMGINPEDYFKVKK